jgi:phage-related protein
MNKKELSERDICTKFITPAITAGGKWDLLNQIREEESFTNGRVMVRGQLSTRGDAGSNHPGLWRPQTIPVRHARFEDPVVRKRITSKLMLQKMDFAVEFYETAGRECPVLRFLEDLKESDPDDHAAILRGLAKLRNRDYHREPLSKALGNGLLELRHVGKLNTRVLWFFVKGRRIIAVHGIRNKGQAIPPRDLETARKRMTDWHARFDQ